MRGTPGTQGPTKRTPVRAADGESTSTISGRVLRDWRWTHGYADLIESAGRCELCGHQPIRYKFEIENQKTKKHLWVGSECIKKFVPIFDERGVEIRGDRRKGAVLDRIVANSRTMARQDRAFEILDNLSRVDPRFQDWTWKGNWKHGFSARQLQLVAVSCKVNGIPFNSSDFRINTRKGWVRQQVRELLDWQYRQLRGALPAQRIEEYDQIFGI